MQFCPNCANPLEDGARFCGACGAKIEAGAPDQAPEAVEPVSPQTFEAAPVEPVEPAPVQSFDPVPQQSFEPAPQQTFEPVYPSVGYQEPSYPQPEYNAGYGAQQNTYQPVGQAYGGTAVAVADAPAQPEKKSKVKLFVIIGVSVVLVAAIVVTLIIFWDKIFGGGSGENDAENSMTIEEAFAEYTGAVGDLDVEKIFEYSYDFNFIKSGDTESRKEQVKEAFGSMDDSYKSILKLIEFKIDSTEKLSDDDMKDRVEALSKDYNDTDKITEIHKVSYTMSAMGQTSSQTFDAIKIDGKWYFKAVDSNSMMGI